MPARKEKLYRIESGWVRTGTVRHKTIAQAEAGVLLKVLLGPEPELQGPQVPNRASFAAREGRFLLGMACERSASRA